MPGIQREELLVLAFDEAHDGFGLGQGADVVFFTCNIEHRASNVGEVYSTPSELDLTLDQFVLLIKVADPLAESLAGEWYTIEVSFGSNPADLPPPQDRVSLPQDGVTFADVDTHEPQIDPQSPPRISSVPLTNRLDQAMVDSAK